MRIYRRSAWVWTRVLLLALATTLSWASSARAQGAPTKAAAKHFARALEHVDAYEYEAALAEFQKAYELAPHYSVLYNLGHIRVLLDQPVEAVDAFEKYLAEGGFNVSVKRRKEVEQELAGQQERIGEILLVVEPVQAAVSLDGRPVAPSARSPAIRIAAGPHTIRATHDGYEPAESTVTVLGKQRKTVELELRPLATPSAAAGELVALCAVPAVGLWLGDRQVGATPLAGPVELAAGTHGVEFRRPGYVTTAKSVAIRAGEQTEVPCEIRVARPLPLTLAAKLSVEVSEPLATVLVDGQPVPPDGTLPRGPHRVAVSAVGFEAWSTEVVLQAGSALRLRVELVPTGGGRGSDEGDGGADPQRVLAYVIGATGIALGVAAAALYGWNAGRGDDWRIEQQALDSAWSGAPPHAVELGQRQDDNDELIDSIHTMEEVVAGFGIAGGALLVTGVVLFATSGEESSAADGDQVVAIMPLRGGAYAGWMTSW